MRVFPSKADLCHFCSVRGSIFPRSIVVAVPCAVLAFFLHDFFHGGDEFLRTRFGSGNGGNVLNGFQFVLGFLIVFRSQQAYSRWWEGGTLLQQIRGEWFNAYSALLAFSTTAVDKQAEVMEFQHTLVRLMSLLYGCALREVTTMSEKRFELITVEDFEVDSMKFLFDEAHDRCEIVLQWIQRLIVEASQKGLVAIEPPILSRVYNQLGNGTVGLSNARKIKEFVIPFPLAQMIMVMLAFHWCLTAVACAIHAETALWAAVLCFAVVFSYWSVHYIAVELEEPFGDDDNDLPLHEMQRDLNASLRSLLIDRAKRPPRFQYDQKKHADLNSVSVNFDSFLQPDQDECFLEVDVPPASSAVESETRSEASTQTEVGQEAKAKGHEPVAVDPLGHQAVADKLLTLFPQKLDRIEEISERCFSSMGSSGYPSSSTARDARLDTLWQPDLWKHTAVDSGTEDTVRTSCSYVIEQNLVELSSRMERHLSQILMELRLSGAVSRTQLGTSPDQCVLAGP